jgi:hypothetical protein
MSSRRAMDQVRNGRHELPVPRPSLVQRDEGPTVVERHQFLVGLIGTTDGPKELPSERVEAQRLCHFREIRYAWAPDGTWKMARHLASSSRWPACRARPTMSRAVVFKEARRRVYPGIGYS